MRRKHKSLECVSVSNMEEPERFSCTSSLKHRTHFVRMKTAYEWGFLTDLALKFSPIPLSVRFLCLYPQLS